jgi:hypothetical protein
MADRTPTRAISGLWITGTVLEILMGFDTRHEPKPLLDATSSCISGIEYTLDELQRVLNNPFRVFG